MTAHQGPSAFAVVILALIFGVIGGGIGGYVVARNSEGPAVAPTVINAAPAHDDSVPETVIEVSTEKAAIVSAVRKVGPAVVKITGRREPRNIEEFMMSGGMISGIGSGFIFDYEGRKLVLTNTHVIGDFTDLTLKLTDGRELKAEPLGRMEAEDLAVLEILNPPEDLQAAVLGNSDALEQGEWVIAAGNPFNYENTVTVGVVSAVGMRQVGSEARKVIQTDAAINAGNSGGPLVDLAGNVVGINYAIFNPEGNRVATTVGIGFAIPVNQAKEMMYFLVHRGPWVGLVHRFLEPNRPGLARYFGLGTEGGVIIWRTIQGTPVHDAGLQRFDVILAVDGVPVTKPEDLQEPILKHKIGDAIQFSIQRGQREMDVEVIAGTVPDNLYLVE